MLSAVCHWLKLQQGPSAEGAVPKYPSRATSSLPYKRRGYSEKLWGDISTKCLFPTLYQRLASHNCSCSLLLSPEISNSSSPPCSHRELQTGKHSQTPPGFSVIGACSRLSISAQLCVSTQGQATEMDNLCLVTAGRGRCFERASLFPQNSPKLNCFIFCYSLSFPVQNINIMKALSVLQSVWYSMNFFKGSVYVELIIRLVC